MMKNTIKWYQEPSVPNGIIWVPWLPWVPVMQTNALYFSFTLQRRFWDRKMIFCILACISDSTVKGNFSPVDFVRSGLMELELILFSVGKHRVSATWCQSLDSIVLLWLLVRLNFCPNRSSYLFSQPNSPSFHASFISCLKCFPSNMDSQVQVRFFSCKYLLSEGKDIHPLSPLSFHSRAVGLS